MPNRQDVVSAARRWLDTPWRHQGRMIGHACDCAGLVIGVATELGLIDFDVRNYPRRPDGKTLRALCDEHMRRIKSYDIGDVLLMEFGAAPQHLGIVGDYPDGGESLIHAYAQARRVVEHRIESVWQRRVVSAYRLPGVA